jgi:hypothetical protein
MNLMRLGTKKENWQMNKKEKAEIWKEHFDKLLNTEDPKELIKTGNKEISEVEVQEITMEDVKKAIRNLKTTRQLEWMEYIQHK